MATNTAFFKIQVEGADQLEKNLTDLTKKGNELKKTKSDLTKEIKGLDTASKTYTKDSKSLNKELAKTNLELKQNNKELNKNQREYIESSEAIQSATGSIVSLRTQLKKQTASYDRLSKAQRDNVAIGGKQQQKIQALSAELTRLEGATGRNQRSVGKYGNAVKGVLPLMGGFGSQLGMIASQLGGLKSSLSGAVGGFKGVGGAIKGIALGGFAVALGGIFALFKNVQTMKEFAQQMANVKAITGATDVEFASLKKSAKDLGSTTQFTATQVGELQTEFAKLGFNTQEILDASEATLELATATGSDLAQSAKVASATLNGFGLGAEETQRVVDVMAKSFSSSALDLSKFETAMASVAPVASVVGVSIEEATASLGTLTDAGFDASTAGTALRNILLDTQKAGMTTAQAFEQIRNSTNPATTALDLFGKRGASVGLTLANNEKKTKAFAKSLENATGSAKAMANIVGDTLDGDLKKLSSVWEGLILQTSEGDFFRGLTQSATAFLGTIKDLTKGVHDESEALEDQRVKTNLLAQKILRLNEGSEDRKKLIGELNVVNKDFLKGLDQENLSNEVLAKRLKEVNKQLVNQILIKRQDEKINEQAEETATATIDRLEVEADLEKQLLKTRQSKFVGINAEVKAGQSQLDQAKEYLKVLDEQAIRTRTQTSFGGSVESSNEQAKQADKLRGVINTLSQATKDLNEESAKADELTAKRVKLLADLGIKEAENAEGTKEDVALTKQTIAQLEELGTEEAKLELLRREAIETNKELSKEEQKRVDKLAKDLKEANAEIIKDSKALRQETNLLGIKDKEKLELAKLQIEYDAQKESFESSIASEDLKTTALLDLETNKLTQEKAIRDKFKAEQEEEDKKKKADTDKIDAEEKAKTDKDEQTRKELIASQTIDLAQQTASALIDVTSNKIDREKDIELSILDAKLQQGLITQADFETQKLAIEKKAFDKKKKLELANIAISLATELASIASASAGNPLNAFTGGGAGVAQNKILAGFAIGRSLVQAGVVASQKFAEGGVLSGPSHANGGIPFTINGQSGFEAEGGETIINKNSSKMFANELSAINQAGGGVALTSPNSGVLSKFANGGVLNETSVSLNQDGLEERISNAVINAVQSIKVVNVAEETTTASSRVIDIENINTF
tara:strand:- start:2524 stop:5979 length:3456 start_codon:yes stop_codon:yes gene_type:complete